MSHDLTDPAEKRQHVLAALQSLPGKKSTKSTYTMVQCPLHPDDSPSGRVSHDLAKPRSIGWYRCYANCCAPMRWNDFAARAGLQPFGPPPEELDVPKQMFARYEDDFFANDDILQREPLRFHELGPQSQSYLGLDEAAWRGFSFDFLRSIGARCAFHRDHSRYYLYLPVHVNGAEVGYIKARPQKTTSKSEPSYLNAPGAWSLHSGLFLFDEALNLMRSLPSTRPTVVLVEGPRDAMRLLEYGVPAMAILGTHSWTTSKIRLLEMAGVERLVLCMDGDAAGEVATNLLLTGKSSDRSVAEPLTSSFKCHDFALWEYELPVGLDDKKLDPGNMPRSLLKRLLRLCES